MKTATPKKKQSEVAKLRSEVRALRSFVIGIAGRDPEGSYRPEFVKQVLQDADAEPIGYFESPEQFLELIEKNTED